MIGNVELLEQLAKAGKKRPTSASQFSKRTGITIKEIDFSCRRFPDRVVRRFASGFGMTLEEFLSL